MISQDSVWQKALILASILCIEVLEAGDAFGGAQCSPLYMYLSTSHGWKYYPKAYLARRTPPKSRTSPYQSCSSGGPSAHWIISHSIIGVQLVWILKLWRWHWHWWVLPDDESSALGEGRGNNCRETTGQLSLGGVTWGCVMHNFAVAKLEVGTVRVYGVVGKRPTWLASALQME